MCRLYGKFASYLRRVLCKARLIFPLINGPIVSSQVTTTYLLGGAGKEPKSIKLQELEICAERG